jgi:hypothetical protein
MMGCHSAPWLFVGFDILALAAARAQPVLPEPIHFWKQESAYVGSQACRGCHPAIYREQQPSNHALSLRPVSDVPELRGVLPFQTLDPSVNTRLLLRLTASGALELQASNEAVRDRLQLEWAFGSGAKGITPVGRALDGQFVEARLSWYRSIGNFEFTTGSALHDPTSVSEALGRNLNNQEIGECFGCHTTGYDAQGQAPTRDEMGIHCERCHGPGEEHVGAASRGQGGKSIFHPGRLGAFAQAQLCGACHGRPPLDNEFETLRSIERTPVAVRFPSQRLVLSRCFNESQDELKCTTCHNPHRNAGGNIEQYDAACSSCHGAAKRAVSRCSVGKRACASCHMPSRRAMRHSQFADHWIRVVRAGTL